MLTVIGSVPEMISTVEELEASYTGATSEPLDAGFEEVREDFADVLELPETGATDTVLWTDVEELAWEDLTDELLRADVEEDFDDELLRADAVEDFTDELLCLELEEVE